MSAADEQPPERWFGVRTGPAAWGADPPPRRRPRQSAEDQAPAHPNTSPVHSETGDDDGWLLRDPHAPLASDQLGRRAPPAAPAPRELSARELPGPRSEGRDPEVHGVPRRSAGESPLRRALEAVRSGSGSVEEALQALRTADLLLPLIPLVPSEQCFWLVICSSPVELSACTATFGDVEPARSQAVTGMQLLVEIMPTLPATTGLLLDPGSGDGLRLPPVLLHQYREVPTEDGGGA